MAEEVVRWLVTETDGTYADFTVGGGGHAKRILDALSGAGRFCGIDRDPEAITEARRNLTPDVELWNIRFSDALSKLSEWSPSGFSGILLDLGVSSHQLDEARRGFSYRFDGPLDLRMSGKDGVTAAELLSTLTEAELRRMLKELGEEPQSARIARAICQARDREAIQTTQHLATILRGAVAATAHKSLPRVFQALRIAVNQELEELDAGLSIAWKLLRPSGRLCVISYHSLEDRPVKRFMQQKVRPPSDPAALPLAPLPRPEGRLPIRGPILPSPEEIARNPRARSAKMRVIEKVAT